MNDFSLKFLKENLQPGTVVYTAVKHVSASGMSRTISLYIVKDGEIVEISGYAASVTGDKRDDKRGGIKVSGCGMDMGFHLVYNLGRVLFPEGFKVTGYGRNGDNSGWDKDGGYALKQRGI